MDIIFGVKGVDFVVLVADTTAGNSIVKLKLDHEKITAIDTNKIVATAGPHADRDAFIQYIQKNVALYRFRHDVPLSVAACAKWMRNEMASALRSRDAYQVNMLVAGCDDEGPQLYFMDYLASSTVINYGAHGYCSYFLLSILDRFYKENLTEREALDIVDKCIEEINTRFVVDAPRFTIQIVDRNGVRVVRHVIDGFQEEVQKVEVATTIMAANTVEPDVKVEKKMRQPELFALLRRILSAGDVRLHALLLKEKYTVGSYGLLVDFETGEVDSILYDKLDALDENEVVSKHALAVRMRNHCRDSPFDMCIFAEPSHVFVVKGMLDENVTLESLLSPSHLEVPTALFRGIEYHEMEFDLLGDDEHFESHQKAIQELCRTRFPERYQQSWLNKECLRNRKWFDRARHSNNICTYSKQEFFPNCCVLAYEVDKESSTRTDTLLGFMFAIVATNVRDNIFQSERRGAQFRDLIDGEVLLYINLIVSDVKASNAGGSMLHNFVFFLQTQFEKDVRVILEPTDNSRSYWEDQQGFIGTTHSNSHLMRLFSRVPSLFDGVDDSSEVLFFGEFRA